MNKQILVVYKSVTGFTKQYAEWIAEKLNCSAVELKKVSAETMSEYKTIIFGGRFHAGFVDGLKNYDHTSKEYNEPLADFVLGEERR